MSNESDLRSVALSQSMRIVKSNEYKYTALLSANSNSTVKGKNRMLDNIRSTCNKSEFCDFYMQLIP